MKFVAVILSGGEGSRLWPVSRRSYPKPFMKVGEKSLLEGAIFRGQACGVDDFLIVTNKDHYSLTQNLLSEMTDPPCVSYLLEPNGRNTAPAITLAALNMLEAYGPDTIMLVLPADHLISNTAAFVANVVEAKHYAQLGELVVFGITPTNPNTGFGYIEVNDFFDKAQSAIRFVEKPDQATANEYFSTGRFCWNSGIFCFSVGAILDSLNFFEPQLLIEAQKIMASAKSEIKDKDKNQNTLIQFNEQEFNLLPKISIDYAVMERATNVTAIPAKFTWSDMGTWSAIANSIDADENGNTMMFDDNISWVDVETSNTHVHVESAGRKSVIATMGISNAIIVHTPDAILVADKKCSQDVKTIVELLRHQHIDDFDQYKSTSSFNVTQRPWGHYIVLEQEPDYQLKRLTVYPGQSLSLQYHQYRAEHWTVVRGQGIIQIGDVEFSAFVGDYRFIPAGEKHRLINNSENDLVLIEVQIGNYLGEDDIFRLQDIYGRA